jgi:hypothetical protein
MQNLEIIHLRSVGSLAERVCDEIRAAVDQVKNVTVYRRDGLETDVCIHIRHSSELNGEPSQLGHQLAAALKNYGLVEQTYWKALA